MSDEEKTWRVIDVLNWAKDYLQEKEIESPQVVIEWIIREVLDWNRMEIYLNHERPLGNQELAQIRGYLKRRVQGEPLEYIFGYTEFMGLEFKVNQDVLIPRHETEVIIEKLLRIYSDSDNINILDIGCGSGNIIISLVKLMENASGIGIDKSSKALEVARQNSRTNGIGEQITFLQKDILKDYAPESKFDLVISNPPYISKEKYQELPQHIKEHEPKQALYPGEDTLKYFRRIVDLKDKILQKEGLLAFEIGGTYQEKSVVEIVKEKFDEIEIIQDYLDESRGILAFS